MSVLHVLAPAPAGGLERVVEELAAGQARGGDRVTVAAVVEPEGADHPFVRRLSRLPVEAREVAIPHRRYLREWRELDRCLVEIDPDVVHTHGYRADVVAGRVARARSLPRVSTVHGFVGGDPKNRFYEWAQRRTLRGYDAVVAVSRSVARRLREAGLNGAPLRVLPNAWSGRSPLRERDEARDRLGLPREGTAVGWVGRLSREKGADLLLRAFARLGRPDLRITVVGDGGEAESLRTLAAGLGIADRVTFHGLVPDAASLYRAFDLFVLSSRTEGTPMVLFEAMHAEVPVVATRVGGVPDVVSGDEAMLVDPGDPAALAAAMGRALDDREAAASRAARARRRLRKDFSPGPWIERYAEVYTEARRRRSARR